MPHIRAIFIDDPHTRAIIKQEKMNIRKIVSSELGYPFANVVFIPDIIAADDRDVAENIAPLLLVIDAGSRIIERVAEHSQNIGDAVRDTSVGSLDFGIWLRPKMHSQFYMHEAA